MLQPEELFPNSRFKSVDEHLIAVGWEHLNQLTKPVGSLGELETIASRLYAIGMGRIPIRINPAIIYTAVADHGVACQEVSAFPQSVTRQMAANYLAGGAAINVLCRANNITYKMIDAGCVGGPLGRHSLLIQRRLGDGTADISQQAAMSVETCIEGLRAGFEIGREAARNGIGCIGTGELGIANSTAATALYCALFSLDPAKMAGPGAGANPAMVKHKAKIITQAMELHKDAIASNDPVRILSALGGFEIAVLTGIMLSCASESLPLVVDGFICTAAFAVGCAIYPPLAGYAFLSHVSAEPGFTLIIEPLQVPQKPLLNLGLRLGEGTGAALAIPLLRSAAAIYNEMATFTSAGVSGKIQRD